MKRVLKIALGVVAALLVVLMVVPFAFKGKIESIVKEEGNKLLNAQFDFEKLDISLIRNFPSASVSLKNFWLKGVGEFENDTLIYAGELTAAVDVMSLLGDEGFDVRKVIIDDTRLHAIVLEGGNANWNVMKSSGEEPEAEAETEEPSAEPSSLKIKLQKLEVSDFDLIYDDRDGDMYAALYDFDASCSGDFASDNTSIRLKAQTPSLSLRTGGVPFLNRVSLKADMNVDADLKGMKFTLQDNELELNAIRTAIDGWIAMLDNGAMDMDLKLNTSEVGFKEILSLIPAIYAKDFAGLKTDGVVTLSAFAKGRYEGEQVPQFDVALNIKNAMFRYPSLPAGVDNINIAAKVQNSGGSLDATTVSINPFNFVLAGNPFSLSADVNSPISDLAFNVVAKGKLDLGKVKDVYPMEDMALNGVVDADMSLNGRISYIEKSEFDRVKAAGNINLSDMRLALSGMPEVDIKRSTFTFTPRYLELSSTTVNVGENDITLDSRFENYLGFLFKGSTLKGTLNVASQRLNLNDFMSEQAASASASAESNEAEKPSEQSAAADTTAMGVINVPENIDFRMQANFKQVLMNKMSFNDVKGLLVVNGGKVDMQNLSLNTMGGSVVVNGSYDAPSGAEPRLDAGFALNSISFAEAYRDLDMVQQFAPIFSNLKGDFSGSIKVNTLLDAQMSPVMNTLNGSGSLSTKDLSLSDVKVINQIADIAKRPDLKNLKAKDLTIDFTINEGKVTTKPFDLKLGDYVMNLSGSTGLDQSIDYRGKITLPASAGDISKLGTVDMTITGTFSSPKVGIDMESLAKQAASQALKSLGSKLGGDSSQSNGADSTATEKKSVVKDVLNIFKKKK